MVAFSPLAFFVFGLPIFNQVSAASPLQQRNSPGCGKAKDFAGQTRAFTIQSAGKTRNYLVSLPKDYQAGTPKPMVMTYHGHGQDPATIQEKTGFSNANINPGWIVVYPAGLDKSWQGPSYAAPGADDLQFTTDLLNQMKNQYCIDTSRVYAAGYSNGGGFVDLLACDAKHGAPFAAFAGVSAALYTDNPGDACKPARSPLPFFEAHGNGDPTIPYNGEADAKGGSVPAIPEWLGRWADRNKCGDSTSHNIGNGVSEQIWPCGGKQDYLHHIKMEGHGHGYPASDDDQIFISPRIFKFLKSKTHPSA